MPIELKEFGNHCSQKKWTQRQFIIIKFVGKETQEEKDNFGHHRQGRGSMPKCGIHNYKNLIICAIYDYR